ncbi:hypothetical protein PAALTS15_02982 [Paenibacillus alvei TS-15]|uniref:Uncharacterized protein n=1 Tax=Paenibacillus alvei TS-15 TaxID=1117108 RepID=S9UEI2_PAEAL|nr:hypothetical protein [Paenibacillus alvei]EPY08900.1 hypothetical protein PAALTS15_02982 [Paenibacillus alvei TS-15]
MKKKWMVLSISFGLAAFVSMTLFGSVATGKQVSPQIAHKQVLVNAKSSTITADPYSKNFAFRGADDKRMIWVVGNPKLAGNSFTTNDPDSERIFDK